MNVPAYKLASFELVDLPLLRKIAETGKPIIMSTGMASLGEIDEAVQTIRDAGATQVALLKCTSAYPALPEEANLNTIPHLAQTLNQGDTDVQKAKLWNFPIYLRLRRCALMWSRCQGQWV